MDKLVEVKVNGSFVTMDSQTAGWQGESNATALRIEFDAGWDGYAKTITWWDAKGENPTKRLLTADLLEDLEPSTRIYLTMIPGEALAVWGKCLFSIDGYINGKRRRSAYASMVVKPNGNGSDVEIEEPSPSQIEQLQVQIDTILEDVRESAVHAARASDFADAAELSADEARTAAESAETAAEEVRKLTPVTPEKIGALPARRDSSGQYWAKTKKLFLSDEGCGAIQATTSSMSMQARRDGESDYRGLYLRNDKADLKECLRLRDEEGNYYDIFGQHNKPTPGELGALPAVPDDDKDGVWITHANTLRMGSTGENYNDDAEGELGKGEFGVTGSHVGMAVRKDSTDSTRRYFRLYDSNAFPHKEGAVRMIDEDGSDYALYGEHNPVIELLWENDAPAGEFAAQSKSLGAGNQLTADDVLMIEFNASVEGNGRTVCFFRRGESTPASVPGAGYMNERIVTVRNDSINFGNGRYYKGYGSTSRTNDNTRAIPLRIWKAVFVVKPPVLAPRDTWYKGAVDKSTITRVSIVDSYTETGKETEVWNADEKDTGAIKCYRTGTVLTIAPTMAKKIRMNPDSSCLFGSPPDKEGASFESLETITGLNLLVSDNVETLENAFMWCKKLKEIDASSWNLSKCTNGDRIIGCCFHLESADLGRGLRFAGLGFAQQADSLIKVKGLSDVERLGKMAFYRCANLQSIDLQPEKITEVGDYACFTSNVEDIVNLSAVPVESIGTWGTRTVRWDAEQQEVFRNMSYPNVRIDVPYPDSQKHYRYVPYDNEGDAYSKACVSVALYHIWQTRQTEIPEECRTWLGWWNKYFNYDGLAHTRPHPSLQALVPTFGWAVESTTRIETANSLSALFEQLRKGVPVFIAKNTNGSGHAVVVVGVESDTGRLLVLDSAGWLDPAKPVTYTVSPEDVFVQGYTDGDHSDVYAIIDFGGEV